MGHKISRPIKMMTYSISSSILIKNQQEGKDSNADFSAIWWCNTDTGVLVHSPWMIHVVDTFLNVFIYSENWPHSVIFGRNRPFRIDFLAKTTKNTCLFLENFSIFSFFVIRVSHPNLIQPTHRSFFSLK